jgi:hypothetical protein
MADTGQMRCPRCGFAQEHYWTEDDNPLCSDTMNDIHALLAEALADPEPCMIEFDYADDHAAELQRIGIGFWKTPDNTIQLSVQNAMAYRLMGIVHALLDQRYIRQSDAEAGHYLCPDCEQPLLRDA